MKVEVTISPITMLGRSLKLDGAFAKGNNVRVLTQGFDVIHSVNSKKKEEVDSIYSQKKNELFTETHPELVLTYDDELALKASSVDAAIKGAIENFYSLHPHILIDGKRHSNMTENSQAFFNMVISTKKMAEQVTSFEDKLNIMNTVKGMSYEKKGDVMDYFGYSPKGKLESERLLFLADINRGILITNSSNAEKFLKIDWTDAGTEMELIIRKAIRLGIIEERLNGTLKDYFYNAIPLGTKVEDCVIYFRANEKLYLEHLVRSVNEKDIDVESNGHSVKTVPHTLSHGIHKKASEEEKGSQALFDLRQEAQQLRKDGYIPKQGNLVGMGYEKLLPRVEAGRLKKAQTESKQ